MVSVSDFHLYFLFNDTATTEIYTLSLHDALPILLFIVMGADQSLEPTDGVERIIGEKHDHEPHEQAGRHDQGGAVKNKRGEVRDRKSTRLNSSHGYISYAVFCLKKKKKKHRTAKT